MKTSLPAFLLSLIALSAIAQIHNTSFENWTTAGSYMEPTGWLSTNPITDLMGAAPSCEQGSPGAAGNFFVKVTTRDLPGLGALPGIAYPGDAASEIDGFPYTARPTALNGQWQYAVQPGDMAMILVVLSKWNPVSMERDEIGTGIVSATGSLSSWQSFSATINYVSTDDPDTATIALMSSSGTGINGSTLWVDDLSFGTAMGVRSLEESIGLDLFPQPATDRLTIRTAERAVEVTLMDMQGRLVGQQPMEGTTTTLDMQGMPRGAYVAQVRFVDGRLVRKTFIKG